MKGLLLAGGTGSRMWPTTMVISKHLIPCYDRPTIYYPLSTLIELGVDDLCIVCRGKDRSSIDLLLADLIKSLNLHLTFVIQDEPLGLAHAIVVAKEWISDQPFWMILGDNLFSHTPASGMREGCLGFTCDLEDPRAFGVVGTEGHRIIRIEEKPKEIFSHKVLTGLYWFDNSAWSRASQLKPSPRGELEITDLFKSYITTGRTAWHYPLEGRWFDNGTADQMHAAASFVKELWEGEGQIIGSPELSALKKGVIDKKKFEQMVWQMPNCHYKTMLSLAPI